jgi:hypothetical protein
MSDRELFSRTVNLTNQNALVVCKILAASLSNFSTGLYYNCANRLR